MGICLHDLLIIGDRGGDLAIGSVVVENDLGTLTSNVGVASLDIATGGSVAAVSIGGDLGAMTVAGDLTGANAAPIALPGSRITVTTCLSTLEIDGSSISINNTFDVPRTTPFSTN